MGSRERATDGGGGGLDLPRPLRHSLLLHAAAYIHHVPSVFFRVSRGPRGRAAQQIKKIAYGKSMHPLGGSNRTEEGT